MQIACGHAGRGVSALALNRPLTYGIMRLIASRRHMLQTRNGLYWRMVARGGAVSAKNGRCDFLLVIILVIASHCINIITHAAQGVPKSISSSSSSSRIAGEGRRVVTPPCPRSTARLQSSAVGRRVESFRSWLSHLFRGRPGGRRHVWSGGRLSDTLMWS